MGNDLFTLYVKKYREFRRMSQSELAYRINKTQGFISQLESNTLTRTKSFQLQTITNIAVELDICPHDLLDFKCNNCFRFERCTKRNHLKTDKEYFDENIVYYI